MQNITPATDHPLTGFDLVGNPVLLKRQLRFRCSKGVGIETFVYKHWDMLRADNVEEQAVPVNFVYCITVQLHQSDEFQRRCCCREYFRYFTVERNDPNSSRPVQNQNRAGFAGFRTKREERTLRNKVYGDFARKWPP